MEKQRRYDPVLILDSVNGCYVDITENRESVKTSLKHIIFSTQQELTENGEAYNRRVLALVKDKHPELGLDDMLCLGFLLGFNAGVEHQLAKIQATLIQ